MSKKLAVIYGAAISLLVSIHIFTFFSTAKSSRVNTKSSSPTVSVEVLMRALEIRCYYINIKEAVKQKDQGIFLEIIDGSKVITSRQVYALKNSPSGEFGCYLFIQKHDEFFNFSLINGGNQVAWKEKQLKGDKFEMWADKNKMLKLGDVFCHEAINNEDAIGMSLSEGNGRKFRLVVKKSTFPE